MAIELYDWQARFNREGLTYGLRLELLELLRPHVKFKAPIRLSDHAELGEPSNSDGEPRIKDLVDWEIVLGANDVHDALRTLHQSNLWQEALSGLLPDLTSLLREALDLMRQLEGADDQSDGSYYQQPSISEHPQNQKFRDWTALIDLTRDAWTATASTNPGAAQAEVQRWLAIPYPLFRRLTFFAATETDLFPPDVSLQWLLMNDNWWLWSVETEHESFRLLTKLAQTLPADDQRSLQFAILAGPPRKMFRDDIEAEKLQRVLDREIWLRLAKYKQSTNVPLAKNAAERLVHISERFPDWRLEEDESDEFPVWMGDSADWFKKLNTPKELDALENWLRIERDDLTNDDWSDRCKDDFPTAVAALNNLGQEGIWPTQRWRTALQAWSDLSLLLQSWVQLRDLLITAPENVIAKIAQPLSWWLQALGKVIVDNENQFLELLRRVLATQVSQPLDEADDLLFKAINHPVGQITDAAFRWWYRQGLEDGQGLKIEPKGIFTELCETEVLSFRYGRTILAANVVALFRVDRNWTESHLLRNFDWDVNDREARAAWSGFLWAPRLHAPLLASIKSQFLATAIHYPDLGQFGGQYANLLTYVALEVPEPFTKKELALATSLLSAGGLDQCARTLVQALSSAGEKRVEYWQNRIRPYLKEVWPKSVDLITRPIANSFARLCMSADGAFPDAVSELQPWLTHATGGDVTLHEFRGTSLAKRFPDAALTFLDTVLSHNRFFLADDLKECLREIIEEKPNFENDPRFERLTRYVQQLGG